MIYPGSLNIIFCFDHTEKYNNRSGWIWLFGKLYEKWLNQRGRLDGMKDRTSGHTTVRKALDPFFCMSASSYTMLSCSAQIPISTMLNRLGQTTKERSVRILLLRFLFHISAQRFRRLYRRNLYYSYLRF